MNGWEVLCNALHCSHQWRSHRALCAPLRRSKSCLRIPYDSWRHCQRTTRRVWAVRLRSGHSMLTWNYSSKSDSILLLAIIPSNDFSTPKRLTFNSNAFISRERLDGCRSGWEAALRCPTEMIEANIRYWSRLRIQPAHIAHIAWLSSLILCILSAKI